MRELSRRTQLSCTSIRKELTNLVNIDIVKRTKSGNRVYFCANENHPLSLITGTASLLLSIQTIRQSLSRGIFCQSAKVRAFLKAKLEVIAERYPVGGELRGVTEKLIFILNELDSLSSFSVGCSGAARQVFGNSKNGITSVPFLEVVDGGLVLGLETDCNDVLKGKDVLRSTLNFFIAHDECIGCRVYLVGAAFAEGVLLATSKVNFEVLEWALLVCHRSYLLLDEFQPSRSNVAVGSLCAYESENGHDEQSSDTFFHVTPPDRK